MLDPDRLAGLLGACLRAGVPIVTAELRRNGSTGGSEMVILRAFSAMRCQEMTPFGSRSTDCDSPAMAATLAPLVLNYADTAQALGVSERSVARLVSNGELRSITVGEAAKRIPYSEILAYVDRRLEAVV